MQRLFLRKTDKAKLEENPKLPYFTLVVPPEDGEDSNGDWAEVGALWKSKSGNGYSGKVKDGVYIDFNAGAKKEVKKEEPKRSRPRDEEDNYDRDRSAED